MTAMFLSKKHSNQKETKTRVYHERSLFPVLTADQLLAGLERQRIISQIAAFAHDHFDQYYWPLIRQFAEFVQVIPSVPAGRLGSLLNEGLRRSLLILQNAAEQANQELDPQFAFAAFSAALVYDVDKVVTQQKIMISDQKGYFIQVWQPYAGPMKQFGEYYKMRGFGNLPVRLSPYAVPVIARQILPTEGFLWIAQNKQLLNMWLSALGDEEGGAGSIAYLLTLAKQLLEQALERGEFLNEVEVENITEPEEVAAAEAFHEWLRDKLEDSQNINQDDPRDSLANVVEEGVLVSEAAFKQFLRENPTYGDMIDVAELQRQYGHLGFVSLQESALQYAQYQIEKDIKAREQSSTASQLGRGLLSSKQDAAQKEMDKIIIGLLIAQEDVFNKPPPPATSHLKAIGAAAAAALTTGALFQPASTIRPGKR